MKKGGTILSIVQKVPEKVLVGIITNKITRKTLLPPIISKVNNKLSEYGNITIDNLEIENTGDRSLDIRFNLKFKDYASFLPLITEKTDGKIKDEKIKSIVNTAMDVIFSEVPDNIKDRIINGIISGASSEICDFVTDILKKKSIPAKIGDIKIKAGIQK